MSIGRLQNSALAGLAVSLLTICNSHAQSACHLTAADKAANAQLSFDDFDQKGVTPSTWRRLEEAGCHAEALEAAEDYLVNGPAITASEKQVVQFHIAQTLALMGRNEEAARMVAIAMSPDHGNRGDLDWNTYLVGTWAFLKRDRARLEAAVTRLTAEPGDGNRMNAGAIRGLLNCFDKPYSESYATACRRNP